MGGIGSGKYSKYKSKPTTASYVAIDLRKVGKLVTLDHVCGFTLEWKKNDVVKNSVDCIFENNILELYYSVSGSCKESGIIERIRLTSTPCHFGGERKWLICPGCNKKVLILYGVSRFRCRKCHGLYHPSSNEGELYRATRAMCNYQDKLNGSALKPTDGIHGLSKPKWMREVTFDRLHGQAYLRYQKFFDEYKRIFGLDLTP
jgi:hypothetical protein